MRCATRRVRTEVLPLPAPATTNSGPPWWAAASRWAGLRSPRRSSSLGASASCSVPPIIHGGWWQGGGRPGVPLTDSARIPHQICQSLDSLGWPLHHVLPGDRHGSVSLAGEEVPLRQVALPCVPAGVPAKPIGL